MKTPLHTYLSILGITLVIFIAGCNLPIRSPTPFVFPTVDQTQAAASPTVPAPVTETPSGLSTATVAVPTATNVPAATLVPATATLPPQPTATLAPTLTPIQPTATIPSARTSPLAVAPFLSKAPVINGGWDDLPSSSEKPANTVVYKNPAYTGTAKAGMSYRIAWDNTYLYIATKIGDPSYNQNSTGKNLYLGDSLEVLIDTNVSGDYYYNVLSADDFQLGISGGYQKFGNKPEAFLWFPSTIAGVRTDVKIGTSNPSAGLYRIEIAIPWTLLSITPSAGMHLGFAISYSDTELAGKSEQDVMVSNDANRVLADPTTWGDLTLTK